MHWSIKSVHNQKLISGPSTRIQSNNVFYELLLNDQTTVKQYRRTCTRKESRTHSNGTQVHTQSSGVINPIRSRGLYFCCQCWWCIRLTFLTPYIASTANLLLTSVLNLTRRLTGSGCLTFSPIRIVCVGGNHIWLYPVSRRFTFHYIFYLTLPYSKRLFFIGRESLLMFNGDKLHYLLTLYTFMFGVLHYNVFLEQHNFFHVWGISTVDI